MLAVHWNQLITTWLGSIRRFPLAYLMAILITVCMLVIVRDQPEHDWLGRLVTGLLLGFPLALSGQLWFESRPGSRIYRWLAFLPALLLPVLWYYLGPDADDHRYPFTYLPLLVASLAAVTLAAFTGSRDDQGFWIFSQELLMSWILGFIYSLVIVLGLEAAIVAIEYLFEVKWYREIYLDVLILVMGIVGSSYLCAGIPASFSQKAEEFDYRKLYLIVVKFIFIPLVLVYFLILYSYGLKIALLWELPKGWVASLCLGFSAAGILVYLFNYYLPDWDETLLLRWYKKYFIFSLIPVILLMLIALYRRISDYGITEERYLVAGGATWLSALVLYLGILGKKDLRFFPVSILVGSLLLVAGPLNPSSVAVRSQDRQMMKLATEKNWLDEAGNWKSGQAASDEDRVRAQDILAFLAERRSMQSWIARLPDKAFQESISQSKEYEQAAKLLSRVFTPAAAESTDLKEIRYDGKDRGDFVFELDGYEVRELNCPPHHDFEYSRRTGSFYITEDERDIAWVGADKKWVPLQIMDSIRMNKPELWQKGREPADPSTGTLRLRYILDGKECIVIPRDFHLVQEQDAWKIGHFNLVLIRKLQ